MDDITSRPSVCVCCVSVSVCLSDKERERERGKDNVNYSGCLGIITYSCLWFMVNIPDVFLNNKVNSRESHFSSVFGKLSWWNLTVHFIESKRERGRDRKRSLVISGNKIYSRALWEKRKIEKRSCEKEYAQEREEEKNGEREWEQ